MSELSAEVRQRVEYWAEAPCFDAATRQEAAALLSAGDVQGMNDRFYRDLEFGTGGMRGVMGTGTCRLNVYTLRKAADALARHLTETFPGKELTVAVTYDSRHNSAVFARETCATLAGHGIRTRLTPEMRPVPFLSFIVRDLGCAAGVCITASHNPPEYNGFKVYWGDGGQLVPPHDGAISRHYHRSRDFAAIPHVAFEEARAKGWIVDVPDEADRLYLDAVAGLSVGAERFPDETVVYTPLHGTGVYTVPAALRRFGFDRVELVPSQSTPDGDFPTVESPNPEDAAALDIARQHAESLGAGIILGTDPDCDRVGMMVREGGEWLRLSGNQLGSLLIDHVLAALKKEGKLPGDGLVIKTIVTTEMQRRIAEAYGVACEDTLTGFKWICRLIEDYETGVRTPYRRFLCGGEESYGFLAGTFTRDKDATIGCALAAQMAAHCRQQGLTLQGKLDELYQQHGYFADELRTATYTGKEGAERIAGIMSRFRSQPPTRAGSYAVARVVDLQAGGKDLPAADVLVFHLEGGGKITLRPSGTEPKIKVYFALASAAVPASADQLARVRREIDRAMSELTEDFLKQMGSA